MEDIFGVSGGYAPYLGTGPGTINAPFEMDNDYDSVPSTSRDSAATNGIDRRGSLQNNRQSPTGKLIWPQHSVEISGFFNHSDST